MSDHTPGPWHWEIHDGSMASLGVGDNPGLGDPLVLSIGPCSGCQKRMKPNTKWQWGRCQTPSEADAHLIKAAPELKDALLGMLDAYWGAGDGQKPSPSCIQKAHAALAKADGKS